MADYEDDTDDGDEGVDAAAPAEDEAAGEDTGVLPSVPHTSKAVDTEPAGLTPDEIEGLTPEQMNAASERDIGPKGQSVLDRFVKRYVNKDYASSSEGPLFSDPKGLSLDEVQGLSPEEIEKESPDLPHGAVARTGIGLLRGVPEGIAGGLQGIAGIGGGEMLEAGAKGFATGAGIGGAIQGIGREALRQMMGGEMKAPEQTAPYKVAEDIQAALEVALPMTAAEKDTVTYKLGNLGGSILPTLAAGEFTFPLLIAQMGLGSAGSGYQAAREFGTDVDTAQTAARASGVAGAAGGALMGVWAKAMPMLSESMPALSSWMARTMNAAQEAAGFGGLSAGDQYIQHQIAKQLYDPTAEFHMSFKDIGANALLGGMFGVFKPTRPMPSATAAEGRGKPTNTLGVASENAPPVKDPGVGMGIGERDRPPGTPKNQFEKPAGYQEAVRKGREPEATPGTPDEVDFGAEAPVTPEVKAALEEPKPAPAPEAPPPQPASPPEAAPPAPPPPRRNYAPPEISPEQRAAHAADTAAAQDALMRSRVPAPPQVEVPPKATKPPVAPKLADALQQAASKGRKVNAPAPEPVVLRLYRGEKPGQAAFQGSGMTGGWFTTDPAKAKLYGDVKYVDVTREDMKHFVQGHGGPDEWVTDNKKFAAKSRGITPEELGRAEAGPPSSGKATFAKVKPAPAPAEQPTISRENSAARAPVTLKGDTETTRTEASAPPAVQPVTVPGPTASTPKETPKFTVERIKRRTPAQEKVGPKGEKVLEKSVEKSEPRKPQVLKSETAPDYVQPIHAVEPEPQLEGVRTLKAEEPKLRTVEEDRAERTAQAEEPSGGFEFEPSEPTKRAPRRYANASDRNYTETVEKSAENIQAKYKSPEWMEKGRLPKPEELTDYRQYIRGLIDEHKAAVAQAKTDFPSQKIRKGKGGQEYVEARANLMGPRTADKNMNQALLWMHEMNDFHAGKKRGGKSYPPLEWMKTDRFLRASEGKGTPEVLARRKEEGSEPFKYKEKAGEEGERATQKQQKLDYNEDTDFGEPSTPEKGTYSQSIEAKEHVERLDAEQKKADENLKETLKNTTAPIKERVNTLKSDGSNLARRAFGEFWRNNTDLARSLVTRGMATLDKNAWMDLNRNQAERTKLGHEYTREGTEFLNRWTKLGKEFGRDTQASTGRMMEAMASSQRWFDSPNTSKAQKRKVNSRDEEWNNKVYDENIAEYRALPLEARQFIADWHDYAATALRPVNIAKVENLLRTKPLDEADRRALAEKLVDDKVTEADKKLMGDWAEQVMQQVDEAGLNDTVPRPYSPASHGKGRNVLTAILKTVGEDRGKLTPAKEKGEFPVHEFSTEEEARDFSKDQVNRPTVWSRIIDKNTGEHTSEHKDPVTGEVSRVPFDGKDLSSNPNLERKFFVRVNNRHLTLHETRHEMVRAMNELQDTGRFYNDTFQTGDRAYKPNIDRMQLGGEFKRLEKELKDSEHYARATPEAKKGMVDALEQHYLSLLVGTRGHSSRMARKPIGGADYNLNMYRNMADWFSETGHMRAAYEMAPKIEQNFKDMQAHIDAAPAGHRQALESMTNEFRRREDIMRANPQLGDMNKWTPRVKRALILSFAQHLATPMFTIRNLTQPWMYTLPELGGTYGYGKTVRMMHKVAREMGYGKILAAGARSTWNALRGRDHTVAYGEMLLRNPKFSELDRKVIREAIRVRSMDPDAALQIEGERGLRPEGVKLDWGRNPDSKLRDAAEKGLTGADKMLSYVEEVTRGMPQAAEVSNRVLTMLTAARLEHAKSGDVDRAVKRAIDTADTTQFRYTDEDKAPIMRHPLARLAFQFKRFGFATYESYGRHIGNMIHNAEPGVRKASAKTLAGMVVSHALMAGALGLPWEPVRGLLIGAKQVAGVDLDWDNVEQYIREGFAKVGESMGLDPTVAGKFSEIIAYGLPHLLNIDMSGGLGQNNMLLFGAPKNGSEKDLDNNFMAWAFQMLTGAVGGSVIQSANALRTMQDDPLKGISMLPIPKLASDIIRAGKGYAEGKKTDRGRTTMEPYTPYEAGIRALGAPVAREQMQGVASHINTLETQQAAARKKRATDAYMKDPSEENFDRALDAGLKPKDLTRAVSAERRKGKREINHVVATKARQERLRDIMRSVGLPEE